MNTGKKTQDERSKRELQGVNRVLCEAITLFASTFKDKWTFVVTDGLRTEKEQAALLLKGATWTMQSKHLKGRAIDICIFVNGKPRWEMELYKQFAKDFLAFTSAHFDIQLVWGGNWKQKDGPHFELKNGDAE